jgi:hypothetical protein
MRFASEQDGAQVRASQTQIRYVEYENVYDPNYLCRRTRPLISNGYPGAVGAHGIR